MRRPGSGPVRPAAVACAALLGCAVAAGAARPHPAAAEDAAPGPPAVAARARPDPSGSGAAETAPGADSTRGVPPFRLREAGSLAARGDGRGQVLEPGGIAVDAFDRTFVCDAALHRLQRFDADGTWLWEAGTLGSDPGQLRRPSAVTPLGTLSVAVLDVGNRRISTWDLFGRHTGTLVDLAALEAGDPVGRVDPVAMAADRGGAVYVADGERDRVLAFDFSGRLVASLGEHGARPGAFRGLRGVAAGPRGEIVTAERAGARVQRLDAGGRPIAAWPLPVRPGGGALAVACDDSGRVAVADEDAGRLWLFAPDGTLRAALDGLGGPRAVTFGRDGSLRVAEARAARVRRFVIERGDAPGER